MVGEGLCVCAKEWVAEDVKGRGVFRAAKGRGPDKTDGRRTTGLEGPSFRLPSERRLWLDPAVEAPKEIPIQFAIKED
jgi:hypothetical protein